MAPLNNPAMKRLKKELEEIEKGYESDDESRTSIAVFPLENNFFEWHFTMSGPDDSDYSEGLYHGRIKFPTNYPFAPPDIQFISKSGRFQTDVNVCLTVTKYHPESWQPAWSSRTILLALRHLMINDDNHVGAVRADSETRKKIAKESHTFKCPKCEYDPKVMLENIKRSKAATASSASEADDDNDDGDVYVVKGGEEDVAVVNLNEEDTRGGYSSVAITAIVLFAMILLLIAIFLADI